MATGVVKVALIGRGLNPFHAIGEIVLAFSGAGTMENAQKHVEMEYSLVIGAVWTENGVKTDVRKI